MVTAAVLSDRPHVLDRPSAADLSALLERPGYVWVDFSQPSRTEVRLLTSVFHFHHLSIEDSLDQVHIPKAEPFPDYLFVVLHSIEPTEGDPTASSEVDAFLTTRFLVTVHQQPSPIITTVLRHLLDGALQGSLAPDLFFQVIASRYVDAFFPVLDALDEEIDAIEDLTVRGEGKTAEVIPRFLSAKRQLVTLKRFLTPQRDVFGRLSRNEFPEVSAQATAYFRDVYDRLFRLTELVDSSRDVLSSTLEAYLSVVSNRLNEVMKVLTVVTVILLPPTLIAGIYGMNFQRMPELSSPYGYPAALASMVLMAVGFAWYFRRRGWF